MVSTLDVFRVTARGYGLSVSLVQGIWIFSRSSNNVATIVPARPGAT